MRTGNRGDDRLDGGEELRSHVRKIDVSLARLADEVGRGQGFRPSRAA